MSLKRERVCHCEVTYLSRCWLIFWRSGNRDLEQFSCSEALMIQDHLKWGLRFIVMSVAKIRPAAHVLLHQGPQTITGWPETNVLEILRILWSVKFTCGKFPRVSCLTFFPDYQHIKLLVLIVQRMNWKSFLPDRLTFFGKTGKLNQNFFRFT